MSSTNISKAIDTVGENVWFDLRFKVMLEQHLIGLKQMDGTTFIDITPHDCEYYQGNFHGILFKYGVPPYLHWLVTRMNGFDSSVDFRGEETRFMLPNVERLNKLKEMFMTVHNI